MKNKIQKFSKGDFRLIRPEVEFEETNLVLIIGEGEVYKAGFQIRSKNDSKIRGLIYPSSFRVSFKDPGFEGNPARVEFTYDGRGLKPGHGKVYGRMFRRGVRASLYGDYREALYYDSLR